MIHKLRRCCAEIYQLKALFFSVARATLMFFNLSIESLMDPDSLAHSESTRPSISRICRSIVSSGTRANHSPIFFCPFFNMLPKRENPCCTEKKNERERDNGIRRCFFYLFRQDFNFADEYLVCTFTCQIKSDECFV